MRSAIRQIASTAPVVDDCTARIWPAMSSVALAVCTASVLTSDATTAKPRPASPARAASMVALSASRLVWPAMSRMSLTTSPIFWAAAASASISPSVACASLTAIRTTLLVSSSWRPISPIEVASSSAATAAVFTLSEASLEARTAPSACCEVSPDAPDRVVAVDFIASALPRTVFNSGSICARNEEIAASTMTRRLSCAAMVSRSCCSRRCSVTSSWVPTQPPPGIG